MSSLPAPAPHFPNFLHTLPVYVNFTKLSRLLPFRNKGSIFNPREPMRNTKRKTYKARTASKGASSKRSKSSGGFGKKVPHRRIFKAKSLKRGSSSARGTSGKRAGIKRSSAVVKPYPAWFKAITRLVAPTRISGQFGQSEAVPVNAKYSMAMWKHLSLLDIQNVLTAGLPQSSTTTPANNALKTYLANLHRSHNFRNSMNGSSCHLEFYQLRPRRDIPANYASFIAPVCDNSYTAGGNYGNPPMFTQAFTDEAKYVGSNGGPATNTMLFSDVSATPFMSPSLCSMFKITPYKVKWPSGASAADGVLLPGEQITIHNTYRGPMLCSWNKFGLDGRTSANMNNTWEVLKETPLIMCFYKGTVSHGTSVVLGVPNTPNTIIGTGPAQLDYYQNYEFELWKPVIAVPQVANMTTGQGVLSGAEQVQVVTGVEVVEAGA